MNNDDAIVRAVAMQVAPCPEHRQERRALEGWTIKNCWTCLGLVLVGVAHDEREACAKILETAAATQPEFERRVLTRAAGVIRGRGKPVGEGGVAF